MTGRWRRSGADPPWRDPAGAHGVPMEGYYWRLVTGEGRVVVALCGVTGHGAAAEALVALATSPGGVTWRTGGAVEADERRLGIRAGDLLRATPGALDVDLGPGERLSLRLDGGAWPRRLGGLGPAGALPGLSQYWHPHALGAHATGVLVAGGHEAAVTGTAYAEKNWGPGFPTRWWWGQAHDAELTVAFAGGEVGLGPLRMHATAAVVALEGRVLRLCAPLALVRSRVCGGRWLIRGAGAAHRLEIEGLPGTGPALRLPVPPTAPGAAMTHVDQHNDGRMRVRLMRGRRLVLERELGPAGLEAGTRDAGPLIRR